MVVTIMVTIIIRTITARMKGQVEDDIDYLTNK